MNDNVFQVVRGTESTILSRTPLKGYVYFALDTKKIYYSDGEDFLPMGGNTGVWYGKMEYSETPQEGQTEFYFNPDEIEGNEDSEDGKYLLPNIDDLIFNTPDGCFYRVIEIEQSGSTPVLHCTKLTVAGGGGGSGGGLNAGTMTVSRIGDQTINTLQGNECLIKYKFIATDAAGEDTGPGTASLYVGGILKGTFTAAQGENEIDVGPYLETGINAIRLVVSGKIGGTSEITQSKNWTIISTNLSLTWNYDETTINQNSTFTFDWTVSISLEHTAFIIIDDIYTIEIPSNDSSRSKSFTVNREEYGLTHGSHFVKMYLATVINNTTFISNTVSHTIICVDENRSDTIISVNLDITEMNQYDTLSIPIVFYNPTSMDGKVSATLREDGKDKDNWIDYSNGVQYYWNYTPTIAGNKVLSILSGTTEKTIKLFVNDLGLSIQEVSGYDFKFKASDITSNNNLQNWSYGSIVPSFSEDFDWINGGLKTEKDENGNDRNYINVKAGSTLSFNYAPLANLSSINGFDIKIVFKATNCRSYDAQVLTVGTKTDQAYLTLTANEGIYKTSGSIISVPYCEDTYIEFEVDAWSNKEYPYLMTWLDGVPTSVKIYNPGDRFDNATANLIIGSQDCDVQIYLIKIYKKHLTNEQHLNNFILDASNATEIINRYNRNNILDDNGEISYKKLIEKNPNCSVYTYEIKKMTTAKDDKVKGCTYARYKGSQQAQQVANNVTIKAQGTSSLAYILAAPNLDSEFTEGFTDYSKNSIGEHIDGWQMSEQAFPVNYFNTKVNIASCEGVNNALNQKWYNRYVPFVTEYHNKFLNGEIEYQPRNTVEFENMGVLFIKDTNTVVNAVDGKDNNVFKDTDGYVSNPYYKMYAICNMGNSKKNTQVFTDPTNPYEVIMEVSDNQTVQQQMTNVSVFADSNDNTKLANSFMNVEAWETGPSGNKTTIFEWRNAPPSEELLPTANQAWYDLIKWFADNNPNAATNEDLPESVTYNAYTFKGYTSAISPYYTPEVQVLKGTTISTYAGTYTKDTYEYRMAKMLNECEDHLIMDAIVFHYLFIERHTLIDNVAKNTFWHTEDLVHWSMIKDYDNDTSDGNDNSGNLTLTYGYEVLDHVDHDPEKSMVFNASNSVWLHFINGLLPARETVYKYLDDLGAWSADAYLKEFDEWQSSLPERVWIEDYYRKYLRPYQVYNVSTYLGKLEGGKKTHQRKQYEIYQEKYMSSEYGGLVAKKGRIDIRANGTNLNEIRIPMVMYADSYIRIAAGSQDIPNVRIRAKRGETYNVQLPITGDANDMTTYFYLPEYIVSLQNIEQLQPKLVNLSDARRLREFSITTLENITGFYKSLNNNEILDSNVNYYAYIDGTYTLVTYQEVSEAQNKTQYFKYVTSKQNVNLETLDFSNNFMLEKLEIKDCPNISGALNLRNSTNLKYLDISDSSFTNILIAPNAPLQTLYLNSPTGLYLSNLFKIVNFNIQGYNKMISLVLDNIDNSIGINSKILVENSMSQKTVSKLSYNLQNVIWNITNENEISDNNIDILDNLLQEDPLDINSNITTNKSLALSGILNISNEAYNGNSSLDLYTKYTINEETNYPNLDINFEGEDAKLYNISIVDGDNNTIWKKKAKKNYIINSDFLATGPNGAFNLERVITKENTVAETYTFSNNWNVYDADTFELITIIDRNSEEDKSPYYNIALSKNIIISPVFIAQTRQYRVTFMKNENEILSSNTYDYGTKINTKIPPEIPSKDDSDLAPYETYHFKGYSLSPNATTALIFSDEIIVNSEDMKFYAVFSSNIDVNNSSCVNYDLFDFTLASYTDSIDSNFNINSGYIIEPKEGLILSGKITIPAFYNDLPIISIRNFGNNSSMLAQNKITGIFFENGTQIRQFNNYAFANMEQLKYLEIPDSLRKIGNSAILNVSLKLIPKNVSSSSTIYYIGSPNSNLYSIGANGFNNCIDPDCTGLIITPSIIEINTSAQNPSFGYFNNAIHLKNIEFGYSNKGIKINYIEGSKPILFNEKANNYPKLERITIYKSPQNTTSDETLESWFYPYNAITTEFSVQVLNATS